MWGAMKVTSVPQELDEPDYVYTHRLKERIADLEAALRPFAEAHHAWDRGEVLGADMGVVGLEHFARAAMLVQ